jgi:hypothetical protein
VLKCVVSGIQDAGCERTVINLSVAMLEQFYSACCVTIVGEIASACDKASGLHEHQWPS